MQALKVLFLVWTNPKKSLVRKRVLQRDVFEGEIYYEAIPTTAILMAIYVYSASWDIQNPEKEPMSLAIRGHDDGTLFFVTFCSSILSATFGLSKALITGPCKIFPGTSLFSGRALLLAVANLFNLLGSFAVFVPLCTLEKVNSLLKNMMIFVSNETSGAKYK